MTDLDQRLPLLLKGYAWLPDLRRRTPGRPVDTRLMGRPAVAVAGPAAAAFFYASGHAPLPRRTDHRRAARHVRAATGELDYYLPPQDLTIDLGRIPAKPADSVRIVVP
jgi:hypothetical protein